MSDTGPLERSGCGAQEGWHLQSVNGITIDRHHTASDVEKWLRGPNGDTNTYLSIDLSIYRSIDLSV